MITIRGQRLRERLETLADLARTPEGIFRLAYSDAFHRSNEYIAQLMREAGMAVRIDPVGNVTGTLSGKTARRILMGSHIDSVRNAGMFDGCLGVIAGIEAVQALREAGIVPEHTLEVVSFAEEEGLVVGGLLGSRAYCGLPPTPAMAENMDAYGIRQEDYAAARSEQLPDYALELHIEQGGVLEQHRKNIGIVTAIVSIRRFLVEFSGTANHAGTTPMDLRDDALVKAARFIQRVPEVAAAVDAEMVATVGWLEVLPGSVNTIPGAVRLTLELRSLREESVEAALHTLQAEFQNDITRWEETMAQPAYPMDREVRSAIRRACDALGYSAMEMGSGAGHDSMSLSQVAKTGMLFVPSIGGISHSPAEATRWEDIRNGTEVLLHTILQLDSAAD